MYINIVILYIYQLECYWILSYRFLQIPDDTWSCKSCCLQILLFWGPWIECHTVPQTEGCRGRVTRTCTMERSYRVPTHNHNLTTSTFFSTVESSPLSHLSKSHLVLLESFGASWCFMINLKGGWRASLEITWKQETLKHQLCILLRLLPGALRRLEEVRVHGSQG